MRKGVYYLKPTQLTDNVVILHQMIYGIDQYEPSESEISKYIQLIFKEKHLIGIDRKLFNGCYSMVRKYVPRGKKLHREDGDDIASNLHNLLGVFV